eukprot:jgi/Picre1/28985/NNA_004379.t1
MRSLTAVKIVFSTVCWQPCLSVCLGRRLRGYGPVPCGGPNDYGGYTSVAQFTTWINDQIWYFNWEGTSIPSVLNTLVEEDVCLFCVDTPGCKYFTWLGPLGGDQYNVAGANCQVADSNATPVPSSASSGNTYGEVQTGNTPNPSPSPPPPSVTPSPPPPSVTPSPPPPSVTPSPPPFFPLPSPPPPPVEKICDIDEGTYLIYGKVIIRAVSRENRNYSSNMSRSSRCGSQACSPPAGF